MKKLSLQCLVHSAVPHLLRVSLLLLRTCMVPVCFGKNESIQQENIK